MYNVSKGPSKIVAKSRRGISQNFEKFESIKESGRLYNADSNSPEKNIVPKPVFQTKKLYTYPVFVEEEVITPQHEEIINYINESWNIVVAQNPYDQMQTNPLNTDSNNNNNNNGAASLIKSSYKNNNNNNNNNINSNSSNNNNNNNNNCLQNSSSTTTSLYCVEPPSPVLSDFKPFDLESWWGRRLFNNITKSL